MRKLHLGLGLYDPDEAQQNIVASDGEGETDGQNIKDSRDKTLSQEEENDVFNDENFWNEEEYENFGQQSTSSHLKGSGKAGSPRLDKPDNEDDEFEWDPTVVRFLRHICDYIHSFQDSNRPTWMD